MPNRAMSICRAVNCDNLTNKPGFCVNHQHLKKDRFKNLKKAEGSQKFYSSRKWKKTRDMYISMYPLCARHKKEGLIVPGKIVDHIKERLDIIKDGENPYSHEYLQTLCHSCHNRKLSSRSMEKKSTFENSYK